mgnify:CR=1 FL=1
MARSNRHADTYPDIRRETQADADRAKAWQELTERKAKVAKRNERIVTWAVIVCLAVVAVRLFYLGTA